VRKLGRADIRRRLVDSSLEELVEEVEEDEVEEGSMQEIWCKVRKSVRAMKKVLEPGQMGFKA